MGKSKKPIETDRDIEAEEARLIKAEAPAKTVNMTIKVKTLIVAAVLLASHGAALYAGIKAPGMYDRFIDGLIEARTAEATPAEAPATVAPAVEESKANQ